MSFSRSVIFVILIISLSSLCSFLVYNTIIVNRDSNTTYLTNKKTFELKYRVNIINSILLAKEISIFHKDIENDPIKLEEKKYLSKLTNKPSFNFSSFKLQNINNKLFLIATSENKKAIGLCKALSYYYHNQEAKTLQSFKRHKITIIKNISDIELLSKKNNLLKNDCVTIKEKEEYIHYYKIGENK